MQKFSKPIKDVLAVNNYIETNNYELSETLRQDELYKKEKKRQKCKLCSTALDDTMFVFERNNIKYYICKKCGHLNGEFEETEKFLENLYSFSDNETEEYGRKFISEDFENYNKRVKNIYLPKAEFLLNSLSDTDKNFKELSYVDFGSGLGHFVKAMKLKGIKNVKGFEVSKAQVNRANQINQANLLEEIDIKETENVISNLKCDVFSMIGVLEHVLSPTDVLKSIKNNKNIKYLYFSLPLFSLASLFQKLFNNVYERQLAGAHTHLFTKESIDYFVKQYGFEIVSEWWFGTDFADLYRGMIVQGYDNFTTNKYLLNALDELQHVLDKNKICSEVHMLVKVH